MEQTFLLFADVKNYLAALSGLVTASQDVDRDPKNNSLKRVYIDTERECLIWRDAVDDTIKNRVISLEREIREELSKRDKQGQMDLYGQIKYSVKELFKMLHYLEDKGFDEHTKAFAEDLDEIIVSIDYIAAQCFKFLPLSDWFQEMQQRAGRNQDDEPDTENPDDILVTTIKENFKEFKKEFNSDKDYNTAITILQGYFTDGFPEINRPIFIRSGNVKNVAFALGQIWRTQKNEPITYNYLSLYKKLFSIFQDQKIDESNLFGCNLYKYSISKT